MNEDSRTDKAKGHLKKAIMIEKQAAEVADNDLFITRLECIQKVKFLYSFLFLLSSPSPALKVCSHDTERVCKRYETLTLKWLSFG